MYKLIVITVEDASIIQPLIRDLEAYGIQRNYIKVEENKSTHCYGHHAFRRQITHPQKFLTIRAPVTKLRQAIHIINRHKAMQHTPLTVQQAAAER
jgi:hypothetical protein